MTSTLYKLGKLTFTLADCPTGLLEELDLLLPKVKSLSLEPYRLSCSSSNITGVRGLVDFVLRLHETCLWIAGATLLSTANQKILISGPPSSGKTTLVLALVFGYNWRVLSEDNCLVDLLPQRILSFGSPCWIKFYNPQSLAGLGVPRDRLIQSSWVALEENAENTDQNCPFDIAFDLEGIPVSENYDLKETTLTKYMSRMMQYSNIGRLSGQAKEIEQCFMNTRYFTLLNGSSKERAETVVKLCSEQQEDCFRHHPVS